MRTRPLATIVLALAAALAASASPAHADLYCVAKQSCPGGTDVGSDAAALTSALATAQSTPNPDRVEVGPGSFDDPNGFKYQSIVVGNTLTLVGSGSGQTILTRTTVGATLTVNANGSDVEDLGIAVAPVSGGPIGFALSGTGSHAHHLAISSEAGTASGNAVIVGPGAELHDSAVTASGGYLLYGISGSGSVYDSSVEGTGGTYGIYGPREVHRVTVRNCGTGILLNGQASYRVSQALVLVPPGARGVNAATTASFDNHSEVDHVTVVGTGDPNSYGFVSAATSGGAPHNTNLVVRSSIARGVGHAIALQAANGDAVLEIGNSDYDPATQVTEFQAIGTGHFTDLGNNVNVDPLFAGADDFHLLPNSPLVDAGLADVQPGESATDRDGKDRAVDGNADGTVATDMGAFEYATPAPPPPPPPPTGTTTDTSTTPATTTTSSSTTPTTTTTTTTTVRRAVSLRLLSRRVRVNRRGRGTLRIRCAGTGAACRVSGRLSAIVATATGRRQRVTLGALSGVRRVGTSTTLLVRLNLRGRHFLAGRSGLRSRLVATVRGSDGAGGQLRATLSLLHR